MKCYFCEKELNAGVVGIKVAFREKEVYVCEHCGRLYKQMEREKIANRDTLLYCSARLTDDTTNPEVLAEMDKYVAEAMKMNEEYFQDRIARGEVEKHELWKCYYCGNYNLKEEEYCMSCFKKDCGMAKFGEEHDLVFYTSKTNPRLETQQAQELSNFSINLVWLVPLFILCLFLTGKFAAFVIIIGFTIWGLSGQKSYTEYYTVGEDKRVRNDLRMHEVNARKSAKENRETLKRVIKQREFLDQIRLLHYYIHREYKNECDNIQSDIKLVWTGKDYIYANEEKRMKCLKKLNDTYNTSWKLLNNWSKEQYEIVAAKYPYDSYLSPLRDFEKYLNSYAYGIPDDIYEHMLTPEKTKEIKKLLDKILVKK